jgi:hypothetical protein
MKTLKGIIILWLLLPALPALAQGVDSDGDGIPDVTDVYPFNPFKSTDDWGQIVDSYPEAFVANDISELNKEGLAKDLRLAVKYFGKYEWEWWAVGQEVDAMLELANSWCDQRIARGQLWYYDEEPQSDLDRLKSICLTQIAHPHASLDWKTDSSNSTFFTYDLSTYEGWMEQYRQVSLDPPSSSVNAGMVRNLGYTATQASWPFVFDPATNPWNIKEYGNAVLEFHEYYHVVQGQHVFSKRQIVDETQNTVKPEFGPTAFTEGSANYISEYTVRKLSKLGIYEGSIQSFSMKDLMRSQMESILNMLPNCPDFQIEKLNYGNPCDPYTFGMWATAYLTNKVNNINAFHEVFWPKIDTLTYVGAFEDTFGLKYDQFNTEFQEFLSLPIEEQLVIVPDIDFVAPESIKRDAAVFSVDTLSIPSVVVNDQAYRLDLKLIENSAPEILFQLGPAESIDLPEVPSSIYYSKVDVLDIAEVQVGSESYSVSLELKNSSDLNFKLVSATKNRQ